MVLGDSVVCSYSAHRDDQILSWLAPAATQPAQSRAKMAATEVVVHVHEVLTWLHHLKNKNKIIECLPDIEPWLAG